MGYQEYEPIAARYRVPIVVTGFEPVDVFQGIAMCVAQLETGRAEVENQYSRVVSRAGNRPAQSLVAEVFEVVNRAWRGIGVIPRSGLGLRAAVLVAKELIAPQEGEHARLKAEVENAGFWPTSLAQAQTARSVKPTLVQLGVEPGDVLSGSAKTSFLQVLAGSGSRAKYEWLIKGKTGEVVELLVQSEKGGSATARVTLK